MKLWKSIIVTGAIIIAVGTSIVTLGPALGKKLTPNLFLLDATMSTEAGKIVALTIFVQVGLLILVLRGKYSTVRSILLGVAAGALLVLPAALKELDTTLGKAITERSYSVVPYDVKSGTVEPIGQEKYEGKQPEKNQQPQPAEQSDQSHLSCLLIIGGKELPLPKELTDSLLNRFPPIFKETQ